MKGSIQFPPFVLDLDSERLREGSRVVSLTPKAFAVMRYLLERPGELVSKEELLEAVWPGTYVGDAVLKVIIGEIRKALGDSSRVPRFIETAHRRGYRFIGTSDGSELTSEAVARAGNVEGFGAPADAFQEWIPETRYARSGNVSIAYQVIGKGSLDLVFVMGWVSHLEYFWREPSFARFLRKLASFARLILFDKRGTGLSDPVPVSGLPTLEQRIDDVRAVLDAIGSERAALCGVSEGGPMAAMFAATYPKKIVSLIMIGTYARRMQSDDYPWGISVEEHEQFIAEMQEQWGGPVGLQERAPSVAANAGFRAWWSTYLRMGASPGAAVALTRMNAEIDIRHVLPTIRVPTLVLHRSGDRCLKVEGGRYLASLIPGARFVELPGADHLPFVGDSDSLLREIEEFVTGVRPSTEPDRVLATVLSAEVRWAHGDGLPDAVGDRLERLRLQVSRELQRFRGRAIVETETDLLATFDGPARAMRCAQALSVHARHLALDFRAGLHTGECDFLEGGDLGGLAVEVAAEIRGRAAWSEVLASSTVRDLMAGAGIRLDPASALARSDVAGEWSLFRLQSP